VDVCIGRGAPVIDGLARRVVIGHPASLPPKPERRRSLQYNTFEGKI